MSIEMASLAARFAPLAGFVAIAVSTAAMTLRLSARGVRTWVLPADDSADGFVARIFRLAALGWFVRASLQAADPAFAGTVLPSLRLFAGPLPMAIGLALVAFGIVLAVAAQLAMGRSWRVGIPSGTRPELVTGGLFSVSRNPVFLGMIASGAGATLLMGDALSSAILAAAIIAIGVQIRQEEQFLAASLGDEYRRYCARTGRWLTLG